MKIKRRKKIINRIKKLFGFFVQNIIILMSQCREIRIDKLNK